MMEMIAVVIATGAYLMMVESGHVIMKTQRTMDCRQSTEASVTNMRDTIKEERK